MLDYLISVLSPLHSRLTVALKGKFVGEDQYGNKYYAGKPRPGYKLDRRWVIYANKDQDASRVPPEWHGWLHHQSDDIPSGKALSYRKEWQKGYLPNMTGTTLAYRPPGHFLKGGRRDKASGDYEAWTPEDI